MININEIKKYYLFSIDLEDVRFWMEDGLKYSERVPLMTEKYLDLLDKFNFKATFFVVGDVAKAYPNLISKIYEKGHEIACHSNKHIPIDKQNHQSFSEDVTENMKILNDCGVKKIYGFRAPTFSITDKTKWAYHVLADSGFVYSSSVLPAKNPLYGWPEHKQNIAIHNKIIEIPMTINPYPFFKVPIAGGIYFRVLPFFIINKAFNKICKQGLQVLGYFHPYDIDEGQEHFMHPGINNNRFYNRLMYYNRKNVFYKLELIIKKGFQIMPYIDYVNSISSFKV